MNQYDNASGINIILAYNILIHIFNKYGFYDY